MKNFLLFLVLIFVSTPLIGQSKKLTKHINAQVKEIDKKRRAGNYYIKPFVNSEPELNTLIKNYGYKIFLGKKYKFNDVSNYIIKYKYVQFDPKPKKYKGNKYFESIVIAPLYQTELAIAAVNKRRAEKSSSSFWEDLGTVAIGAGLAYLAYDAITGESSSSSSSEDFYTYSNIDIGDLYPYSSGRVDKSTFSITKKGAKYTKYDGVNIEVSRDSDNDVFIEIWDPGFRFSSYYSNRGKGYFYYRESNNTLYRRKTDSSTKITTVENNIGNYKEAIKWSLTHWINDVKPSF